MAITKADVTGQYFVVGMDIARDGRLSLSERGMMLTLLSLPPEWRFTVEGMVAILPDGRSRVRSSFKKLEDFGYVKRSQGRKEDGSYDNGSIEVYQKSILLPPVVDLPMSDNPSSDFPTTDEKTQVNNQISNNHKSTMDLSVGTLPPTDYERLCSLHDKGLVDSQIERIKANHYLGYMNFEKIDLMCKERENRKPVSPPKKKNSFHNFEERHYSDEQWAELERKMLTR